MHSSLVSHLVKKDWELNKAPLTAYVLLGALALWLFITPGKMSFLVGSILLITVVITIGVHMVISTVVNERKNQTLTFIMSLPVSYQDYTLAKVIANMTVSGIAWLLLYLLMSAFIMAFDNLPVGLLPYATMVMLYLFVIYSVLLAVAMVSESETITIVVMTLANVTISIFMIWLGGLDSIKQFIEGPVAVWNSTALIVIGFELAVIVLSLISIFYFQAKKRSFL